MSIEKWKLQLRKGILEFATLLVIENKELYGLEIFELLSNFQGLTIAEGTIYPLLNRLVREGKLETKWVEKGPRNHPRKYYQLTSDGHKILQEMRVVWKEFQKDIKTLNEGDYPND